MRSVLQSSYSQPKNTIYINEAGVRRLVVKSQKPQASKLARELGIKEETRYLRKEIEIVAFLQEILTQVMIPFEFQKTVANYRVGLCLPKQRLAIEIDENNRADRDPSYEQAGRNAYKRSLGASSYGSTLTRPTSRCLCVLGVSSRRFSNKFV